MNKSQWRAKVREDHGQCVQFQDNGTNAIAVTPDGSQVAGYDWNGEYWIEGEGEVDYPNIGTWRE